MEGHRPKARTVKLLVQELGEDLLVYDMERNQAHSFNGSAAQVWKLCDGRKSVSQIAALIAPAMPLEDATKLAWYALAQFEKAHLLDGPARVAEASVLPRRELMLRLGLAVALIPVVDSIVSPPALHAQSGGTGSSGATPI